MDRQGIHLESESIAALCRRYGISKLSLFGSVLTEAFRPDSDVDVLIEFPTGETPSLLTLGAIQSELQQLIGREVDLKTPEFLSRYFRAEVMRSAEVQYVA